MRRLIALTNHPRPAILVSLVDFFCQQGWQLFGKAFVFEIYTGTSREQVSGGLFLLTFSASGGVKIKSINT